MDAPQHASRFCAIPTTILEQILQETALVNPLGPPADIVPLLQTCRYLHHVLSLNNNRHLYARIFRSMFDYRAASRRFGPRACYSSNLAVQLKKYCSTLRRIRHANLDSDTLNLDLWNAFFMMMENDGRNAAQLEWAGLKPFVDRLVRERLWHGREASHDWPAENTVNALALWLMWFTTDQGTSSLLPSRSFTPRVAPSPPWTHFCHLGPPLAPIAISPHHPSLFIL